MSDAATLTAMVAYAQEVVFGYQVTLAKAPLTKDERATLQRFGAQASADADVLRAALQKAGGTAPARPDPNTAPPPKNPSLNGFLSDVITVEEASVARCYEALQELSDPHYFKGTAAIMAQGGRRLVVLRKMTGRQLLPRAFETGGA